jgi:zinc transporter ZupT
MIIFIALLTFFSTLLGGLVGLKYKDKIHLILGFTAGVLLSVVAFDVFPEIIKLVVSLNIDSTQPMIALVVGFLVFHILEKTLLIHHSQEENYSEHKHPSVGVFSGLALAGHSFLDGVGIGLGFQVSPSIGIFVAIAVIAHDFSDGLNTVTLALINKNTAKKAFGLLLLDAAAPVLGIVSTNFFALSENVLLLYLGFFAGFLLYIGVADILPEAHSQKSSLKTILMTIIGIVFIFLITKLA